MLHCVRKGFLPTGLPSLVCVLLPHFEDHKRKRKISTLHSVKKLDICTDFGYLYSLNWHLITTLKKAFFRVCIAKYES